MLNEEKPEVIACALRAQVIKTEVFDEKVTTYENITEKQITSNQTSSLTPNDTTQVSGNCVRKSTQSRKRRRNYTETDNQNVVHLYHVMGLSYREIQHITGMCMGSIQLRVAKDRKKFPERKRNVEITDEYIEQLKELCANNKRIDQLQART